MSKFSSLRPTKNALNYQPKNNQMRESYIFYSALITFSPDVIPFSLNDSIEK